MADLSSPDMASLEKPTMDTLTPPDPDDGEQPIKRFYIPAPPPPEIYCAQTLHDWLIYQGLHSEDQVALFTGTINGLMKIGVPLERAYYVLPTLHPLHRAVGSTWYPGKCVEIEKYPHRMQEAQAYLESPMRPMVEGETDERYFRLDLGEGLEYPLLRSLAERGVTGWFGVRIGFGANLQSMGLPGTVTTWGTTQKGGFTEDQKETIRSVLPPFGLALYRMSTLSVATNLMTAYVGQQAGERILSGNIVRGRAEHMKAAILLADLRGFSSFANTHSGTEVLDLLNDYHTAVTDAVESFGGEVFKFVGDGLLAVFPIEGTEKSEAACQAYRATLKARLDVGQVATERKAEGKPTLEVDFALHTGEVEFGNVGSRSRLDFTVIGPAVNETSRMEYFCEPNDVDLVMSREFVQLADAPARHLGDFELRGFEGARPIYALAETSSGDAAIRSEEMA